MLSNSDAMPLIIAAGAAVPANSDWTKPWTLIIALIALAQPWAISLYRRFFLRRDIKVIPSGRMEIGYSLPFGSHLALKGAIYSKNTPTLVKSMFADVRQESNGSVRKLRVHMFRDPELRFSGTAPQVLVEAAKPILIERDGIEQFYAVFIDYQDFAVVDSIAARIQPLWNAFRDAKLGGQFVALGQRPDNAFLAMIWDQNARNLLYSGVDDFLGQPEAIAIVAEVDALFHWRPGDYHVTLLLAVEDESRNFPTSWPITITPADEATLKSNMPIIMRNLCGLNDPTIPKFVYAQYKELAQT